MLVQSCCIQRNLGQQWAQPRARWPWAHTGDKLWFGTWLQPVCSRLLYQARCHSCFSHSVPKPLPTGHYHRSAILRRPWCDLLSIFMATNAVNQLNPPPLGRTGRCMLCCTVSANRCLTSCLNSIINVYQYEGWAVRLAGIDFFSVLHDKKDKRLTFSQLLRCSQCFMQSDSCSNHSHLVILTLQNHLQENMSMCF